MFWMKLAFPAALLAGALLAAAPAVAPGARSGGCRARARRTVLAIWLLAAFVLLDAAPAERES